MGVLKVWDETTQQYVPVSGGGGGGGTEDHGLLLGLGDDDHPHYHTDARGDARYYTQAQVDSSLASKADTAHTHTESQITDLGSYPDATGQPATKVAQTDGADGWTFIDTPSGDHGSLQGLTDDDHPQYLTNARGDSRYVSKSGETGSLILDAANFTIASPPVLFRYPDMSDAESSKGAIIEWGGVMDGASHPFGIATRAYQQNPAATFIAPTGYRKWAWVTAHYDSPVSTGEAIHQHLNLETVKSDWLTAVTRFQISFGEDEALVSFPNSHTKFYPDYDVLIGSDAEGMVLRHDTATGLIIASTDLPVNFSGTGGLRVGSSGAPAGMLHIEQPADEQGVVIRNTLGSANSAPMLRIENGTPGAVALQATVIGNAVSRFSMNTSGRMDWGSGSVARDTALYRDPSTADLVLDPGNRVRVDGPLTIQEPTLDDHAATKLYVDAIKTAATAATDFADFQARIAAL